MNCKEFRYCNESMFYLVVSEYHKDVVFKTWQKARSFALKCGYRPSIYNPINYKTWSYGEY